MLFAKPYFLWKEDKQRRESGHQQLVGNYAHLHVSGHSRKTTGSRRSHPDSNNVVRQAYAATETPETTRVSECPAGGP